MNHLTAIIATMALGAPIVEPPAFSNVCQEDMPCWHCPTDGNRTCGPNNAEGIRPGCYSDTGTLVASWPCYVVVYPNGESDIFTP